VSNTVLFHVHLLCRQFSYFSSYGSFFHISTKAEIFVTSEKSPAAFLDKFTSYGICWLCQLYSSVLCETALPQESAIIRVTFRRITAKELPLGSPSLVENSVNQTHRKRR
jgi:hypothetical protein